MKRISSLILTVMISAVSFAQTAWKVDPAHSKITFTVTHLGISDVLGQFKEFDVTAKASRTDFSDAVFDVKVKTSSIDTEVEMRDNHLKSPDFFDVEKNPEMTFRSTTIKKSGNNRYRITGDFTLNGITKPVTMELWYRGTTENPMSKAATAGFQLTGSIKRSDFNFGTKFGAPLLSDEVKIKADGEFTAAG